MSDSDETYRQDQLRPGDADSATTEAPSDSAGTGGIGGTRRGSLDAETSRGDDAPYDLDPESGSGNETTPRSPSGT